MNDKGSVLNLGFTQIDMFDVLPYHRGLFADLAGFGAEDGLEAGYWLEQALAGSQGVLSFSPGLQTEALISMYNSARNLARRNGVSAMGLGFPFVLWHTPQQTIAAPLLIWPLILEPEAVGPHKWYLSLRENKPVMVNEVLCRQLQERTGADWQGRMQALGPRPDWAAIAKALHETDLDFEGEGKLSLYPCPGLETLGADTPGPRIASCGVVGLFPPAGWGTTTSLDNDQGENTPCAWRGHTFGLGTLEPHQAVAAEGIRYWKKTMVSGGPGTGKTFLFRNLMTNTLSNGGSCLVLADTLPPLQEIQQSLSDAGLGRLCFTFCDPREDLSLLRDYMRAEIFSERPAVNFDNKTFRIAADKLNRLKEKLDKAYRATHTPILGADGWTNVVGGYLKSSSLQGKDLLAAHLAPADYHFEEGEFDALLKSVEAAFPLFQRIKGIDHPLSGLHPDVFLLYPKQEATQLAAHKIPAYERRVSELLHRYISTINAYSDALRGFLEGYCRKLGLQVEAAVDLIRDFSLEYGDAFQNAGDASLYFSSFFSRSGKRIIASRQEIRNMQQALREKAAEMEPYGLDTGPLSALRPFAQVADGLLRFQERLKQWALELPDFVQAETLRMSASQLHETAIVPELPAGLEAEMDDLLQEINADHLLQRTLEHRLLTLSKRGKYLEHLLQELEGLRLGMRDFPEFYDWHRFWLDLPDNARKLIRALTILKPKEWSAAFRSWYLDQALLKHQDLALPQELQPLEAFAALSGDLQRQLPDQIVARWEAQRAHVTKKVKSDRTFGNWLLGKGKKGSEKLAPGIFFNQLGEYYSEVFPVTFATLEAARELFTETPEGFFETVFLLEGQEVDVLWYDTLARLGRRFTVSGDFGKPAKAVDQGWHMFYLGAAHREDPLNPFLPPLATAGKSKDIQTSARAVEGVCDPHREINLVESECIVDDLLYRFRGTASAAVPSVAIVAFTPAQRDFIAATLMRYKYGQGPEAERVRQLERGGLSVLALGELESLQSDLVLVSVVFSSWPAIFSAQGAQAGTDFLQRMRRLLGMSRRETIIYHSVSNAVLQLWQESDVHTPEGFLGNFLMMASGNALPNCAARLAALRPRPDTGRAQAVFWEAVEERIRPFFPGESLRYVPADEGRTAALQILPEDSQVLPTLLLADGFVGTLDQTDYSWEAAQAKMISAEGFQIRQLWSVNWWRQPDQEARRLAGELLRPPD
ncbi:MAG: hypothetical protein RL386_272 [Bacteroidota bacterium]